MNDVSVNGVWLSTLNIMLVSRDIPPLPETEENTVKLAGRDGVKNFGSTYAARPIGLGLFIMGDDYYGTVAKLASVFDIKNGPSIVIFDDIPEKRLVAEYRGSMAFDTSTGNRKIDIPMKMDDPWVESVQDTTVREYGQGLKYGQGYYYSDYATLISGSGQSIIVRNEGSAPAYPMIRIRGAFTNLNLSDGVSTLILSGTSSVSDVWEINCDPDACTIRLNGQNAFSRSNGVFFELRPGSILFTATGSSLSFNLAFVFRYKYLY
ncbi:Phage tail protein [compost metagenome]